MQQKNPAYAEIMSHNVKMIGADVHVIKNGGWRGKVEEVIDEEYFLISRFDNPSVTEKISMYDIRSLSYETL
tara:strand:- start:278 stop:493 length:216 start_codon:yes stop_codon:yes gene_type:complete